MQNYAISSSQGCIQTHQKVAICVDSPFLLSFSRPLVASFNVILEILQQMVPSDVFSYVGSWQSHQFFITHDIQYRNGLLKDNLYLYLYLYLHIYMYVLLIFL